MKRATVGHMGRIRGEPDILVCVAIQKVRIRTLGQMCPICPKGPAVSNRPPLNVGNREEGMDGRGTPKRRRYLGSCDVYLSCEGLKFEWDDPPSDSWPAEDFAYWHAVTHEEVIRAVAIATGRHVLGIDVTDGPEKIRVVGMGPAGYVSRPNRKRR
jgi:hypothetical protein